MKKINIMTAAVLAASFGLVGCGGGGGAGTASASAASTTVQGTAVDPELIGAIVCLDNNGDNVCDSVSVKTNMDGKYSITVNTSDIEAGTTLLVQGGYDRVTKMPFVGTMTAMIDENSDLAKQMITPLTTLVYERAMAVPETMEEAQQEVADLLGLTYDEVQANMLKLTNNAALKAAMAMQQAAELAAEANDTRAFYQAMADRKWDTYNDNLSGLMTYAAGDLDNAKKLKVQYFTQAMDMMNGYWIQFNTEYNVMSVEQIQEMIAEGKTYSQIASTMLTDMISGEDEMEAFVTEHLLLAAGVSQDIIDQVMNTTIVDDARIAIDTSFTVMITIMGDYEDEIKAQLDSNASEAQTKYDAIIDQLKAMKSEFEPASQE